MLNIIPILSCLAIKFKNITTHPKSQFKTIKTHHTFINGDDIPVSLLHSIDDKPAKIKMMYNKLQNDYTIISLTWYHYGKIYRSIDPLLPAKIEYYNNDKKRCEYFYNYDGKLHSHNDQCAYISYFIDGTVSEKRWYNNGVLLNRIEL